MAPSSAPTPPAVAPAVAAAVVAAAMPTELDLKSKRKLLLSKFWYSHDDHEPPSGIVRLCCLC